MNVLCTGSNGYLGSMLCPLLLQAGHEVVAVDNFRYGQTSLAECCADPGFTPIRGDCRDMRTMGPLIKRADVVIPLAAIVGAQACDADVCAAESTNFGAILSIIGAMSPSQRIIYPNSNSGYGVSGEKSCTEESPMNPVSLYGVLKAHAEEIVLRNPNAVSFRFATLFGMSPRMRTDLLVNDFCFRAKRDRFVVLFEAKFRRNYLHIRDAASVFLWAIEHFDEMKGRPYNAGLPDANLTKWELCERIKTHVPDFYFCEAPVGEDPDKRNYICDNSRILATGWKPRYSLDDGIKELIKGYEILKGERFENV